MQRFRLQITFSAMGATNHGDIIYHK